MIDPRDWQGKPVPERQWFVEGLISDRTVTNLSGDGGSGKTEIILQLIAAASLQTQWFGKPVSTGPCLYYGAEDEADELHRRLETIVRHAGKQLSDLAGIRLSSYGRSGCRPGRAGQEGNACRNADLREVGN